MQCLQLRPARGDSHGLRGRVGRPVSRDFLVDASDRRRFLSNIIAVILPQSFLSEFVKSLDKIASGTGLLLFGRTCMGRLEVFYGRMQPRPGSGRSTDKWRTLASCHLQKLFLHLLCAYLPTCRSCDCLNVLLIPSTICGLFTAGDDVRSLPYLHYIDIQSCSRLSIAKRGAVACLARIPLPEMTTLQQAQAEYELSKYDNHCHRPKVRKTSLTYRTDISSYSAETRHYCSRRTQLFAALSTTVLSSQSCGLVLQLASDRSKILTRICSGARVILSPHRCQPLAFHRWWS